MIENWVFLIYKELYLPIFCTKATHPRTKTYIFFITLVWAQSEVNFNFDFISVFKTLKNKIEIVNIFILRKQKLWYTNQRVTSYELISLRVVFIAQVRVTSYFYCTSYELLFAYELRVTIYCTSYDIFLLHELQVIDYCTSYELLFIAPVTSYFVRTSYG